VASGVSATRLVRAAGVVAGHAALAGLAAATLLPLAWMAAASLMPAGEATQGGFRLWPSAPTLEHYRTLFARLDVARNLANSALLATVVTVLSLAINTAAGYAFAKLRFAGRERLFRGLLVAMVIPGQVAMLPLFLLLERLGLVNTYAGVIVPGLASIFAIFLVRQYALGVPDSLLDAARVDGAGEARVFFSIALPACRPILVTLAVFTFLGTWNDFLWPLVILSDDRLQTLPVALANLAGEHVQDTELMMAGAVLTVVPVIVLFLALQRQYLAGLLAGALKE
jgi:multiple sugar transport system permease protein